MQYDNEMKLEFVAKSENEAFARVSVAAFVSQLDPLIEDISDIKTAVSEAVTNAVIHGYDGIEGKIVLFCGLVDNDVYIEVIDKGHGIEDIEKARQPLYTSKPNMERSGMGFTVMEMFMDDVIIESKQGSGTTIKMRKSLERP